MGAPKALRAVGREFEVGRDEVSEENKQSYIPNICHEKIIKMERKLLFLHTKLLQFDHRVITETTRARSCHACPR